MMKRALLALLALAALVPPVEAAYPTQDTPTIRTTFRVAKAKRIAVIRPKRWSVLADVNVEQAVVANGVYQAMDMLQSQGCEVDLYNTSLFTDYGSNLRLWQTLGDYYGLAIVMNPASIEAGFQRFVNGDSTNVQILVVGGIRENGGAAWVSDSTSRGFFDSARGAFEVRAATRFTAVVPYGSSGLGTDTVWSSNLPTGRMKSDSSDGGFKGANRENGSVLSVKRVLHPINPGNKAASWATTISGTTDTLDTNLPSTVDSVVHGAEYLGPIWKVSYAPSAHNADTSEVWFYKFSTTASAGVHNPCLLWACIARFVDVPPIRWALDFDDVTDYNDSAYPRWRNSAAESTLSALRAVGIVPSNGLNPGKVTAYLAGTTPAYEPSVAWSGDAHTYLKHLNWVHHSHDSTTDRVTSGLVGGYGGYVDNGAVRTGEQQYGRRFASRYNPTQTNPGNFMAGGGRYGILQRLQFADSVRRSTMPGSKQPPYLTFPANQMLPVNWKTRANPSGYENQMTADTASCPIDSVLWALDLGINGGDGTERRKLWLRSGLIYGPRIEALWADRDSFVASTLSPYPRDRYTIRTNGRYVQANIIHSFNQGAAVHPRASYVAVVNLRASTLLGLSNKVIHAEMHNPLWGETYDSDVNKQMNYAGTAIRDFPARQSTRVLYLHPAQFTTAVSTSGDVTVDVVLTGMHATFRAMDAIAGKATQVCVPAWQVYR